ncbi:MAG: hypothetical protein ABJE47_07565 [bacterium]
MKILLALAAATLATVAAHSASAQQVAGFKPFEPLVGHCWVGTFPDGKQTDEHCFDWVFDHKFIRDRHVVRHGAGPYEGETIYSWDAKQKRVVYSYYNSEGQVITGVVNPAPGQLVFPSHYDTPKGTVQIRAVWSALNENDYTVAQSQKSGTKWKQLWTMTMKRQ